MKVLCCLKNITGERAEYVYSFMSSGRFMRVKFKSDKEFIGWGLHLFHNWWNMPKACSPLSPEKIIVDSTTMIKSHFAPNSFISSKLECTWIASVQRNQLIKLQIKHFDFTQPGDYVEVRDGLDESAMVLVNFTSTVTNNLDVYNQTWLSGGWFLLVKLGMDGRRNNEKFILSLEPVKKPNECVDEVVVKTDRDLITSPFYPLFYPNKQKCTWLITAPKRDQVVAFRMEDFHLAQPGDYVEVRDELYAVLLHNYTSKPNLPDKLRTSSGWFVRVKFKSDQHNTAKGFKMSIKFQTKIATSLPPPTAVLPSLTSKPTNSTMNMDFLKNDQAKEPKLSISAVVGIGLGSIALVLFVLFVLIRIKRRNYSRNKNPACNSPWEVTLSQVELIKEIGHGAFGKVWKGCMDRSEIEANKADKLIQNKKGATKEIIVAVKMLYEGASPDEQNEFLDEIELMKNVGFHRNIISMVACCTKEEQVFLVVEYAKNGDLLKLLRDKRKKEYVKFHPSSNEQTPNSSEKDDKYQSVESLLEELMSFSWQIAQGMEYLSSKGIVHRDLAARNVLVAEDLLLKVADFGLSRHVTYEEQVYHAQGRRKLPLKWMSPEALDDQIFTSKSDVWSYGVVLWEMYSLGKPPYPNISNQQLLASLKNGYRMEKPDLCPDDIYELMRECWQEHAQNRPSFNDVIHCLESVMTRDKPYVQLINIEIIEGDDGYLVPLALIDSEDDTC